MQKLMLMLKGLNVGHIRLNLIQLNIACPVFFIKIQFSFICFRFRMILFHVFMVQAEMMEQKQDKYSEMIENLLLLKQIMKVCMFLLIQVFISTVDFQIFLLQQLQMEELFEIENILAEQSEPNLSQLGQPWQVIHNRMQKALGKSSRIQIPKNSPVSKKKLLNEHQYKYVSKMEHAPIIKQTKRVLVGRNTATKKQLKLDNVENQFLPSTISFTERVSNPYNAEYFDSINQIQQSSKESQQSKNLQIAKTEVSKMKSRSDNKEVVNCIVSEFLFKVNQDQRERTARSTVLVFPQINNTNKRQLPNIYKRKKEDKGEKCTNLKQQNDANIITSKKKEERLNLWENLPTEESQLECSKIQTLKCSKVMCLHSVTLSVEKTKQAKENTIPVSRSQVASLFFNRMKAKSIHSLDSKIRRNTLNSINMRYRSLQKLKNANKKENQSKCGKNEIRNVGKEINELRQMKHRLYLHPNNNVVR